MGELDENGRDTQQRGMKHGETVTSTQTHCSRQYKPYTRGREYANVFISKIEVSIKTVPISRETIAFFFLVPFAH